MPQFGNPLMEKDNVELICDIGELAGIYDKTRDLLGVLNNAVSMIAFHMKAAVCSIYLYNPREDTLRLAANQGLAPDAVGNVVLQSDEGLTSKALRELRVINVGRASQHPENKHIPGINEEKYESFLAMPILRGLVRIGVLVVQDVVVNYFSDNDERAVRAIASQVARIIENANALMQAHDFEKIERRREEPQSFDSELIRGQSASRGIAIGEAFLINSEEYDVLISAADEEAPRYKVEDFRIALEQTAQQLNELQTSVMENMSDVASQIFVVQMLLLKDRQLIGPIEERIAQGEEADRAITGVFNDMVTVFSKLDQRIFQEKTQDLKDLGHRLLANLHGDLEDEHADYTGKIVIAQDLLPSDIVKLSAQNVEGLIVIQGTVVSHIAIIARSLNIPMVFTDRPKLLNLPEHTPLLLDAIEGNVFVHPSDEVKRNFQEQKRAWSNADEIAKLIDEETYTADGSRVQILANINLLNDVGVAKKFKAEGVGLYRSEMPFLVRSEFPSEEAQRRVYSRIVDQLEGREVVFRTLDIGGDKVLPYHRTDEANPFMGLRAIRFSLRNKMLFKHQLNALLRAGARRIMFPFISSLDDFIDARAVLRECQVALIENGEPHSEFPEVGAMVELPAAVEIIDELAAEADFLSIGTNDLVQYYLAVDRTNENVRDFYVPYHPAVLRALKKIADAGIKHRVDVCICGDIARDPRMVPFLLGIGLKKLSVNPRMIHDVQKQVKQLNLGQATATARQMLAMGRVSEIREFLEDR